MSPTVHVLLISSLLTDDQCTHTLKWETQRKMGKDWSHHDLGATMLSRFAHNIMLGASSFSTTFISRLTEQVCQLLLNLFTSSLSYKASVFCARM